MHGAADPNFACAVRVFAAMFPGRRYGGGALAVFVPMASGSVLAAPALRLAGARRGRHDWRT